MKEDIHELSFSEIIEKLKYLSGWEYDNNKIKKGFKFNDFLKALDFINNLKGFFEENDHHPDIHIYYNKVIFELTRWDVGGKVTNLDFITAKEIEDRYSKFS